MSPFRGPSVAKRILLSLSVAVLALSIPSVAAADDNIPVSCTLTLGVIDPGTLVQDGNIVNTTGEKTLGELDCDVDAMDGVFSTVHSSTIAINPDGSFSGNLEGTFRLDTARGRLGGEVEADINGVPVGLAPVPPFPPGTPIHMVWDIGTWELNRGRIRGEGTMSVTLVGVVGLPAAMGGLATIEPGSMNGEIKIKGNNKGHHEDKGDNKGHHGDKGGKKDRSRGHGDGD